MKLFADFTKRDDDQRIVAGYASTEALDCQGEVVEKAAIEQALGEYMKFGNVRRMHAADAVGVCKSATVDEKGLFIEVHVVDEDAWAKIKAGVYKGFSIGGKALQKVGDTIKALRLTEISIVDRPANPEAVFSFWKGEGMDDVEAVEQLAETLEKGEISPAKIMELVRAELSRVIAPLEAAAAQAIGEFSQGLESGDVGGGAAEDMGLNEGEEGEVKPGEEGQEPAEGEEKPEGMEGDVKPEGEEEKPAVDGEAKPEEAKEAAPEAEAKPEEEKRENPFKAKAEDVLDLVKSAVSEALAKADAEKDTLSKAFVERDEALAKVAGLESELAKAAARVKELEAMPEPAKGYAKVVEKADDKNGKTELAKAMDTATLSPIDQFKAALFASRV